MWDKYWQKLHFQIVRAVMIKTTNVLNINLSLYLYGTTSNKSSHLVSHSKLLFQISYMYMHKYMLLYKTCQYKNVLKINLHIAYNTTYYTFLAAQNSKGKNSH